MIRLIATDVDETLIQSDHHTISARTRAAFAAAVDAGITVTAISGRQPYSIAALVEGTVLAGPAIGSNGSAVFTVILMIWFWISASSASESMKPPCV